MNDSWNITKNEIDNNISNPYIAEALKSAYFSRLVSVDIWPPFKRAIISKNEEIQIQAIENMENLLDSVSNKIFNQISIFKFTAIKGVIDKYLFLTNKSKNKSLDLLSKAYNKLDANSKYLIEIEHKYFIKYLQKAVSKHNKYYIYKYLIRRRIGRIPETIKNKIKKYIRITFRISKIIPVNNNKVILASNKSSVLTGNLKFINDELIKRNKYYIRLYNV